jgi:uncharacterized membrane protein YheB (UPF0754 family)
MSTEEIVLLITQIILPILLGAIIGFVTNAIAIKMLFRPLTKKYIGKIPIPLTPGIIPKQRESLAHSIADMVSNQLFSPEVVKNHINSDNFRLDLRSKLFDFTKPTEDNTKNFLKNLLSIIRAKSFRSFVNSLGEVVIRAIFEIRISDLAPEETEVRSLMAGLSKSIVLGAPGKRLESFLHSWLEELKTNEVPLEQLVFSKALQNTLKELFISSYPAIKKVLMEWLRNPVMRKELSKQGRSVLRDILGKLNPLQRIVVSAGQYDKTLDENMGSIIVDILNSIDSFLTSDATKEELFSKITETLANLAQSNIKDLDERFRINTVQELSLGFRRLKIALVKKENHQKVFEKIEQQFQDKPELKIGDLLKDVTGHTSDSLKESIFVAFEKWSQDENAVIETLESLQKRFGALFTDGNVEIISKTTPEEDNQKTPRKSEEAKTNEILLGIENILIDIMNSVVPKLVAEFDIYGLVVDRINSLEMIKVEQLLLGIISRHLRYINIFGAILGGIIGASQVLVRYLS